MPRARQGAGTDDAPDLFRAARPKGDAALEAMLSFERAACEQGFRRVAGIDEAGRGPLAGPIVAAAVVLAFPVPGLNDSKLLSEARREELFSTLSRGEHDIGVAVIEAEEIDRLGIQQANYAAMARAVDALASAPDYLLVDGFQLPGVRQPALKIIKGDQRSQSIAAASIVAKVTRDRLMLTWAARFPEYGFERHKGYGTREHLDALARNGVSPIHRRSFAPCSGGLNPRSML